MLRLSDFSLMFYPQSKEDPIFFPETCYELNSVQEDIKAGSIFFSI